SDVVRPAGRFALQIFPAGWRQAVELRTATEPRHTPLRRDEIAILHPMECGVERAVEDRERAARRLLDPARDGVTVLRPTREPAEHEHVERPLQHFHTSQPRSAP